MGRIRRSGRYLAQSTDFVDAFIDGGQAEGGLGGKTVVAEPTVNMQRVKTMLEIILEKTHGNLASQGSAGLSPSLNV